MGHSALAVANYFIDKAKASRSPITHLHIQKMVYLAHGWHLALHEKNLPLVDDEYPEAWKHGPVFPSVYHELKLNGSSPIKGHAQDGYADPDKGLIRFTPVIDHDLEVEQLLDKIYEVYGQWTGGQLISLTHREGTPWAKITKSGTAIRRNENIDDACIREYFQSKLEHARK